MLNVRCSSLLKSRYRQKNNYIIQQGQLLLTFDPRNRDRFREITRKVRAYSNSAQNLRKRPPIWRWVCKLSSSFELSRRLNPAVFELVMSKAAAHANQPKTASCFQISEYSRSEFCNAAGFQRVVNAGF